MEIDWSKAINARDIKRLRVRTPQSRIDMEVSRAIGKTVYLTDPKLINWVVSKKGSGGEQMQFLLQDPKNIEELKELFR